MEQYNVEWKAKRGCCCAYLVVLMELDEPMVAQADRRRYINPLCTGTLAKLKINAPVAIKPVKASEHARRIQACEVRP